MIINVRLHINLDGVVKSLHRIETGQHDLMPFPLTLNMLFVSCLCLYRCCNCGIKPKTCINYFQKGIYGFNINEL